MFLYYVIDALQVCYDAAAADDDGDDDDDDDEVYWQQNAGRSTDLRTELLKDRQRHTCNTRQTDVHDGQK